ncbi:sulfurtransferase complex subunit TusB [Aliiglaciecola litoralis]|uniref:Sulfurtransferase complex subunit TusB n=1 Tax=Aliiglaciecola litoralis TaxID=582857 RepID=A0ABN1LCK5_9ALTE
MILHKFTGSPFTSTQIADALDKISTQDSVILTLEAVYACLQPELLNSILNTTSKLYFIADDLVARGLILTNERAYVIDYHQFVSLVEQHHNVMSWQ